VYITILKTAKAPRPKLSSGSKLFQAAAFLPLKNEVIFKQKNIF
jgi:hypothetical protein